jgi:hypothetical protein
MRSRHFRNGRSPITVAIDAAADHRTATGQPRSVGLIASDVVMTLPASIMLTEFEKVVKPTVSARLKARGDMLVSTQTWHRKTDMDITDTEFHVTLDVKEHHHFFVTKHLKADRQVGKFLDQKAKQLGRPVTMGEFEAEIDKIYASHGIKP